MNTLISDLASFQLAMVGVMVSLLAIVFAVVTGKCDELRAIKDSKEANVRNRIVALRNSKDCLSTYCKRMVAIIFTLLLAYIGSIVQKSISCQRVVCLCVWVNASLTFIAMLCATVVSINAWKVINKDL